MSAYQMLSTVHVGLGTLALLAFWGAGLARKGSPVHRAAGRVYQPAMAALLLLAVPMAAVIATHAPVIGAFLGYLLVITATALWTSWRAIRDKRNWARYTGPVFRTLMWLNLASGLAVAWLGMFHATEMKFVITAFSLIGIVIFVQMWRFSRHPPSNPRWWLKEHLEAMLGNGIATHVAFLSIGLPRLLPMLDGALLRNLAWLAPVGVAMLAGACLGRKYLPARPADAGASRSGY